MDLTNLKKLGKELATEIVGQAKEAKKEVVDWAERKQLKEKISTAADDAKEKISEAAEDAKEAIKDLQSKPDVNEMALASIRRLAELHLGNLPEAEMKSCSKVRREKFRQNMIESKDLLADDDQATDLINSLNEAIDKLEDKDNG